MPMPGGSPGGGMPPGAVGMPAPSPRPSP
jgi:hypothetical protein